MNGAGTRVKICGITRTEDAQAAAALGADAIGLVFYPPSPRCLTVAQAREICLALPPFVTAVALFVNERPEVIRGILDAVPVQSIQFHGEETAAQCAAFGRPYVKAARMSAGFDLLEFARPFLGSAQGLVLDSRVEAYGGVGQAFDWSWIPRGVPLPIILSGGLDPDNVAEAIRRVRPWAVDVSSGVEVAKGIKDSRKIAQFIAGVRNGNAI